MIYGVLSCIYIVILPKYLRDHVMMIQYARSPQKAIMICMDFYDRLLLLLLLLLFLFLTLLDNYVLLDCPLDGRRSSKSNDHDSTSAKECVPFCWWNQNSFSISDVLYIYIYLMFVYMCINLHTRCVHLSHVYRLQSCARVWTCICEPTSRDTICIHMYPCANMCVYYCILAALLAEISIY